MTRITEYTAVSQGTVEQLAGAVAELINHGWEPFGSIGVALDGGLITYAQGLVKREEA